MKKISIILAILALTLSCKTQYIPVPIETATTVNVKDSTAIHYIDSVRLIERSRYKDYGSLLDTLRIDGNRAHTTAWIDTTLNILNSTLTEDPIEEKTKYIFKDRIVYKDSLVYEEKQIPIEVPVEVKYVPKVYKILSAIGLLTLLSVLILLGIKIYRLKGKGFLNLFKKT